MLQPEQINNEAAVHADDVCQSRGMIIFVIETKVQ